MRCWGDVSWMLHLGLCVFWRGILKVTSSFSSEIRWSVGRLCSIPIQERIQESSPVQAGCTQSVTRRVNDVFLGLIFTSFWTALSEMKNKWKVACEKKEERPRFFWKKFCFVEFHSFVPVEYHLCQRQSKWHIIVGQFLWRDPPCAHTPSLTGSHAVTHPHDNFVGVFWVLYVSCHLILKLRLWSRRPFPVLATFADGDRASSARGVFVLGSNRILKQVDEIFIHEPSQTVWIETDFWTETRLNLRVPFPTAWMEHWFALDKIFIREPIHAVLSRFPRSWSMMEFGIWPRSDWLSHTYPTKQWKTGLGGGDDFLMTFKFSSSQSWVRMTLNKNRAVLQQVFCVVSNTVLWSLFAVEWLVWHNWMTLQEKVSLGDCRSPHNVVWKSSHLPTQAIQLSVRSWVPGGAALAELREAKATSQDSTLHRSIKAVSTMPLLGEFLTTRVSNI